MKKSKGKNLSERAFEIILLVITQLDGSNSLEMLDLEKIISVGNYTEQEISMALDWIAKFDIFSEILLANKHSQRPLVPLPKENLTNETDDSEEFLNPMLLAQQLTKSLRMEDSQQDFTQIESSGTKKISFEQTVLSNFFNGTLPMPLFFTTSKDSHRILNKEERNIFSKEALSEFYQLRALGMLSSSIAEVIILKAALLGEGGFSKKDLQYLVDGLFQRDIRRKVGNQNRVVTFACNDTVH